MHGRQLTTHPLVSHLPLLLLVFEIMLCQRVASIYSQSGPSSSLVETLMLRHPNQVLDPILPAPRRPPSPSQKTSLSLYGSLLAPLFNPIVNPILPAPRSPFSTSSTLTPSRLERLFLFFMKGQGQWRLFLTPFKTRSSPPLAGPPPLHLHGRPS